MVDQMAGPTTNGVCHLFISDLDCKTVVFFANASDGKYLNERSEVSVKMAKENGERPHTPCCPGGV